MSSFNTAFLLASFLFACLAFARPVEQKAAANDLISDVCSMTGNPVACEAALRVDPDSAKADLKGLGHISIGLSKKSATTTLKLINAVLKGGDDDLIDACQEFYEESIGFLGAAESALNSGDYMSMNVHANDAIDGPIYCESGFEGAPHPEPPQLNKGDEDLQVLIAAVLEIADRLLGEGNKLVE
ncbi:hypothetical protein LguiA_031305 [Lonicera macranthoides]